MSIPSISDRHTGENIANGVGDIITEFGLEKRIGYFVLDNAANNDKAIEALGSIFGFDPAKRRIRCAAHIVNLVAMQIMYGKDLKALNKRRDPDKQIKLATKPAIVEENCRQTTGSQSQGTCRF